MLIVGHRGARDIWPENSLTGFRNLRAMPVEAVEFDIHRSADGGVVVIHDPTLERTALGEGPVGARALRELTATRLRDSSDTIPTLDEVLEIYADSDFELHVEIKTDHTGTPYEGLERLALESLARHRPRRPAMLTCFAPEVIETVRRLSPETPLLASVDRRAAEAFGGLARTIARFASIPGLVVAVEKGLLAQSQPQWLAAFGGERLGVWVPNTPEDLRRWIGEPLRQMTTDRPDLALEARRALAG